MGSRAHHVALATTYVDRGDYGTPLTALSHTHDTTLTCGTPTHQSPSSIAHPRRQRDTLKHRVGARWHDSIHSRGALSLIRTDAPPNRTTPFAPRRVPSSMHEPRYSTISSSDPSCADPSCARPSCAVSAAVGAESAAGGGGAAASDEERGGAVGCPSSSTPSRACCSGV